jgi:DNA-directed RNA polymerase subunit RPC12/RpoP
MRKTEDLVMTNAADKARRMEIRKRIRNRIIAPVQRPRRSVVAPYLIAHACFECRKSFKLSADKPHACPDCGGELHAMGRSFRVPRRDAVEQWRKVQTLFALGFRFIGHGSSESERLPRYLRDVAAFVARNPKHRLRVAAPDMSLLPKS